MKKISTKDKYILKGKKVVECNDLLEWGKWIETGDKIVKEELLKNGALVSTIFLGLDYNFSNEGSPIVFQTMVFKGIDKYSNLDIDRCSTWKEAEKMHKKMVKEWKEVINLKHL